MPRPTLTPFAIRVWLKRRERRLILEEHAAVQAALNSASPEQRGELERLLALHPGTSSGGSERVAADRSRWA